MITIFIIAIGVGFKCILPVFCETYSVEQIRYYISLGVIELLFDYVGLKIYLYRTKRKK